MYGGRGADVRIVLSRSWSLPTKRAVDFRLYLFLALSLIRIDNWS